MRTRKAYQVNYERLQKSVKHTFLLCFCCAVLRTLENTVIPACVPRAFFSFCKIYYCKICVQFILAETPLCCAELTEINYRKPVFLCTDGSNLKWSCRFGMLHFFFFFLKYISHGRNKKIRWNQICSVFFFK